MYCVYVYKNRTIKSVGIVLRREEKRENDGGGESN
jgi:hypothetical protein